MVNTNDYEQETIPMMTSNLGRDNQGHLCSLSGHTYTIDDWRELRTKASRQPALISNDDIEVVCSFEGEHSRAELLKAREKALTPAPTPTPPQEHKMEKSMPRESFQDEIDQMSDVVIDIIKNALEPIKAQLAERTEEGKALRTEVTAQFKELSLLRERVGISEVRGSIPGPAGRDGVDGKAGVDGRDGMSLEDFSVDFDGERTIKLKFERGGLTKVFPLVLPFLKYQGVWKDGTTYVTGDTSTWGGSAWVCNAPTTRKPGESPDWTLAIQKGREGKAGLNGKDGAPATPQLLRSTRPMAS